MDRSVRQRERDVAAARFPLGPCIELERDDDVRHEIGLPGVAAFVLADGTLHAHCSKIRCAKQ
jgi:hypothetical protein